MAPTQKSILQSYSYLNCDVISLLNSYMSELENSRIEMRYPYELLSSGAHIWPDQYKYALSIIDNLFQSLNSIAVLTRDFSNFPLALRSKRYTLLFSLDKSLFFAKNILVSLNMNSEPSSSNIPAKPKASILENMELLMSQVKEVTVEIQRFLQKWEFVKSNGS